MPSTASFLLWFLLIVALIPLCLWVLKRSPMLGQAGSAQATRLVGSTSLGPQQRVVTLEVGQGETRQWLVLGVTPQQIRTLHVLGAQELPAEPAPGAVGPAAPFAALFHKARRAP